MDKKNGASLKIKTFGITDVQYNGESIFKKNQNTSKIMLYLQYLIINRGVFIKPEKIMEDIWPDTEYANDKKIFQYYAHKIRSIISPKNGFGKDFTEYLNIINDNGAYQLWVSPRVEIDTDLFSVLVNDVSTYETEEQLIETAYKLKSIYTGHFMCDAIEERVVLRARNYYFNKYCSALGTILKKLSALGKYSDVKNICEDYFSLDDLDESINCIFLDALIKTGQTNYAARHFNFITKKMQGTLHMEPSKEMKDVLKSIKVHETALDSRGMAPDNLSGNINININMIRAMVDEIVAERLDNKKKMYSFLKLDVIDSEEGYDYKEVLEETMLRALRKKDIYYVLDSHTVIAILYDAAEQSYEAIKARVTESFSKMSDNSNVKINVIIDSALSVV